MGEQSLPFDYIQDGLVFQLDGIKRGGVEGHWVDLVSGIDFTLHDCVEEGDHVSFDGNSSYGNGGRSKTMNYSKFTIEACYRGTGFIFAAYPQTETPLFYALSNRVYYQYGKGWNIGTIDSALRTVGACSTYGMANSAVVTTTYSNSMLGNGSTLSIGKRINGSYAANPFNGDIYGVRIYNRELTQEEMLHNQSVDNARFNLGLTI